VPPLVSLIARLNSETRAFHEAADRPWYALLEADSTKADYMRALVGAYGFEAPLEAALAYTPGFEACVGNKLRYRSGFIAQDLLQLGLAPAQLGDISQCLIAPFPSVLDALGWFYVHERSLIVHEAIRRDLIGQEPTLATSCSYLSVYAGAVGVHLDEVAGVLQRHAPSRVTQDRVVASALEAFRTLRQWLDPKSSIHSSPVVSQRAITISERGPSA
jgi:heme oxygenase